MPAPSKTSIPDVIRLADFGQIGAALGLLTTSTFGPKTCLIPSSNHYYLNGISGIKSEIDVPCINQRDIAQYIGASIFSHALDGWTYFSRGIAAYLDADSSTAIHLIYYSEMRAIMSIMASLGIGVFNQNHVFLDATSWGWFPGNTHKTLIELYREWITSYKFDCVLDSIVVEGKSLNLWLSATSVLASSWAASSFLKAWGIDFNLGDDKDLRNEISYRPHFDSIKLDSTESICNIQDIWKEVEPLGSTGFEIIDRNILRRSLSMVFKGTTGNEPSAAIADYQNFVKGTFAQLGLNDQSPLFLFLVSTSASSDHFILKFADYDRGDTTSNIQDPLPMICRAFLLLRVAIGCSRTRYVPTMRTGDLLKLRMANGIANGIIANQDGITGLDDLYVDIADAIKDISLETGSSRFDSKTIVNTYPLQLHVLKQFQRVWLWGIGS